MRKFYRDGIEETITGDIEVYETRDGHVIEKYTRGDGSIRYFATIAGTPFCAHGETEASAISDAIWKDESKRPSLEAIKEDIQKAGPTRLITLNEFRTLTGACLEGCHIALKRVGLSGEPMTAKDVRDKVSREWGGKLIEILGWGKKIGRER